MKFSNENLTFALSNLYQSVFLLSVAATRLKSSTQQMVDDLTRPVFS